MSELRKKHKERASSDPAVKGDGDKLRFDLVPIEAMEEVAKVYTVGAVKYEDRNWEKGMKWSRMYAAMERHAKAFWRGETYDPETGIHHMAHAAWNCLALIHYTMFKPEFDDRPVHAIPVIKLKLNKKDSKTFKKLNGLK